MKPKSIPREATNDALARDFARRTVAAARAAQSWSWDDLSCALRKLGIDQTANNLSTKHSRGAFRAAEFLLILRALDVTVLDLSKLDVPGLRKAISGLKRGQRSRTIQRSKPFERQP